MEMEISTRAPEPTSTPLQDIRAIFFDLDDTLCAYWEAARKGLEIAFAEFAPGQWSVDDMIAKWAEAFRPFSKSIKESDWYPDYLKSGEPTRTEQMRRTLELCGVTDSSLAARLSERYAEARDQNLRLFPDAVAVLEGLRGNYLLGLITNGPADVQRQEIETLGIEEFFNFILIEGEMGQGKPHPRVLQKAEKLSGCKPHQILFVGNSYRHDVRPAIEAGWRSVWIRRDSDIPPSARGQSESPEEKPIGGPEPDFVVGSLTELTALLPAPRP